MFLKSKITYLIGHIKENRIFQIFIIVLFIGAALRFYGVHNAENTDEYNEVIEALRVASGEFNLNRWHKKGYQNILALEFGVYYVAGYLLNAFSGPMDFAAKIIGNMEPLFLIGRYTTATMGTLSILLLYLIGNRLYNQRVALTASAFFAVTSVHVWTSHLVGTDVPLTFFFLLSLYFISRFYTSGKIFDYFLAALFAAVAINMKIIGVGVGLIFITAHILKCKKDGIKLFHYFYSKEIFYSFVAFVFGYAISNPAILVGFKEWSMSFLWRYGIYTNVVDDVPFMGGSPYYTYLTLLYKEFGLPLFLTTITGLIYAFYRRTHWDYVFVIFVAGIYLILANSSFLVQNRYMMIMLPVLLLLSARCIDAFICNYASLEKRQLVSILIITSVLSAYPLINSMKYVITLTKENTSKLSKRWIEENIPAGSKLLIDAGRTIITSGPKLNQSREKLEEKLNLIKNLKKGETFDSSQVKIVDSYSSIYFELMLKNMPTITYNIISTELGRKIESAAYYKENSYDYFIHDEGLSFRINDPVWREKYPKSAIFYDSIDDEFNLVKIFHRSQTRSGPNIKVYKIR